MARVVCAHCGGTILRSEDGPECLNCGRPLYAPVVQPPAKRVYLPGAPGPRRADTRVAHRRRT